MNQRVIKLVVRKTLPAIALCLVASTSFVSAMYSPEELPRIFYAKFVSPNSLPLNDLPEEKKEEIKDICLADAQQKAIRKILQSVTPQEAFTKEIPLHETIDYTKYHNRPFSPLFVFTHMGFLKDVENSGLEGIVTRYKNLDRDNVITPFGLAIVSGDDEKLDEFLTYAKKKQISSENIVARKHRKMVVNPIVFAVQEYSDRDGGFLALFTREKAFQVIGKLFDYGFYPSEEKGSILDYLDMHSEKNASHHSDLGAYLLLLGVDPLERKAEGVPMGNTKMGAFFRKVDFKGYTYKKFPALYQKAFELTLEGYDVSKATDYTKRILQRVAIENAQKKSEEHNQAMTKIFDIQRKLLGQ